MAPRILWGIPRPAGIRCNDIFMEARAEQCRKALLIKDFEKDHLPNSWFMRLPIRGKYLTLEVRVCRREKKLGFYNVNYNWCKPNTMMRPLVWCFMKNKAFRMLVQRETGLTDSFTLSLLAEEIQKCVMHGGPLMPW